MKQKTSGYGKAGFYTSCHYASHFIRSVISPDLGGYTIYCSAAVDEIHGRPVFRTFLLGTNTSQLGRDPAILLTSIFLDNAEVEYLVDEETLKQRKKEQNI